MKVDSRAICRFAGGSAHLKDATGRQYQTILAASTKGLVVDEDGALYVRYCDFKVPPETVARRLRLIAQIIDASGGGNRHVDPVKLARRCGEPFLTSRVPLTDSQYAVLMLGADPVASHLDYGTRAEVCSALLKEANRLCPR